MQKSDLRELHYITPITNVQSILASGILCNHNAQALRHESVAMLEIQQLREERKVPGGLPLHKYVNLYFNARNPMMFLRQDSHKELTVLRISPTVLDIEGPVVADGNASSEWTAFRKPDDGLSRIEPKTIYARYWIDDDPIEYYRKKRMIMAEVLIPEILDPGYIEGAYASCEEAKEQIEKAMVELPCTLFGGLFFNGSYSPGDMQ